MWRIALAVVVACAGTARALPDPTADGPDLVGYVRTTFVRTGTVTPGERSMESVVWYPAEVAGEPQDGLGYADAWVRAGRHPVLVYSHGGCAYPEVSTFLTRGLASWGFIVIAPSHPGDTIYDGLDVCDLEELRAPTLVERVDDVRAVLDAFQRESKDTQSRFFRRVARSRVGVLGWSSGASTAIVAGRDDPRIRAVLSLAPDARPQRIGTAPVGAATMVMVGELDYYDPQQTTLDQVYATLQPPRFAVHLLRTGHFAFSDPCLAIPGGRDCEPGSLTQDEAHRLVRRFAVPFLRRYVGGAKAWGALLRPGAAVADAELRAQRRRPPKPPVGSPY